ncbi:glycosyltransferase family 39 protein [Pedobacter sp. SYSU D00535]|uniref:glycosyltransferase family 39 protein n=1 Tax=Pedobacter sp. SYSU D00535 TaxID=2810308 RepID=UPI001A964DEC|nr:glycosyltransferase family 39 protein [Pedobacter sp. SYSU D00535]
MEITTPAPERESRLSGGSLTLSPANYRVLTYTLIAAGVFLRLFHYFYNRSLWTDEMYLSLSFLEMDFVELATEPLVYQQKAPIGFLWLVELAVVLFGDGEMALRLVPLLAGIASLYFFKKVADRFLTPAGIAAAVGILALAPNFVYHSVEIKQYGVELLVTILVLYFYVKYAHRKKISHLLAWGVAGALLIWFSYSSIFVLTGMALAITLNNLFRRKWKQTGLQIIPFSMWMISFILNFFLFTYNKTTNSGWLIDWFTIRLGYIPLPPKSFADVSFLVQIPYKMLFYPLGLLWEFITIENGALRVIARMGAVPLIFWAAGLVFYFRRKRVVFMILLFPMLLALLASAVKQYPFYERLTLFLAPLIIILIAKGFETLSTRFSRYALVQPALLCLLLIGPLGTSAAQLADTHLFGGYKRSYQRDCWLYVNQRFQPGDAVYVYWNIRYGYLFYKKSYDLKYDAVIGNDYRRDSRNAQDYLHNIQKDINGLKRYRRVWLVYEKDYWVDIGDYDGVPNWYFKNYLLREKVNERFGALGPQADMLDTKQARVVLLNLED